MGEYQEKVTTSQNSGTDEAGNVVQQKTKKIDTSTSANGAAKATNIVWFIVGVIEVSLLLRFVLKLLGANPASGFVDFIYTFTGVLTAPFDNIFGVSNTTSGTVDSVFEPSILVAAIVYALIGWGIVKLINITHKTD
jgi:YGGT family